MPKQTLWIFSVVISGSSIYCSSICGSQEIGQSALDRAQTELHAAIESGDVAGAAHLVGQNGKVVYFEVAGVRDTEGQQPLERDTIVRIYSMSKPIVSVAAMTLYEQGSFALDDPVSKFIPVFAKATVLVKQSDAFEAVPGKRPITVRDLFRHTSGYAYGGNGNSELESYYRREGMHYHPPHGMLPPKMTIGQAAEALARIPAHHHPGERFTYGFNTDLLGRLIEIWSGKPLDEYLKEAVLNPLEMRDTDFSVPPEKRDRFASCHTGKDGKLTIADKATTSQFNDGFEFLSGGGGLVSTMDDYANFCQMLVDDGRFKDKQILKKSTLELMFTDQLNGIAGGFQFGLGFAIADVDIGTGDESRKAKQYSWGGYAGTEFRVVPEEKLFQVFMRQHVPASSDLANKLFSIVYAGLNPAAVEPASNVSAKPEADRSVAIRKKPDASPWLAASTSTAYWPGWRGPKRDGWVSDFQTPADWPEQLEQVWQVEVGTGYGSPLVAGGRVYQHARQQDDEVVWCLDLETGDVKWRQSYAVPFEMGGGGERHGKGPKSSPMIVDGRVFTMSITGVLSAWDAVSGKLLWRRDYNSRFGKSHPYWGASTSPIVDDQRVIVHFGTDEEGALVALDVENGQEVWSQGKDGPSYSSPILAEINGIRQIIEWNHRALVSVESESGRFLWEYPFPHVGSDQNMPTPAFHNGRVLLGGENRGIHCLEPQRNQDADGGVLTVKERWYQKNVALDMSSAVVNGDLLFGFSHYGRGRFFCLDTETGEILWQGPGRTGDNAMLLAIPDHIVALLNDGELKIINASGDRFRPVASYQVAKDETWAPPVIMQSAILVKDKQTLTRWSLADDTPDSPAPSLR